MAKCNQLTHLPFKGYAKESWDQLVWLPSLIIITNLPKVIWEEGRVAALSHTYAVKSSLVTIAYPKSPQSTPSRGPIPKTPTSSFLDPTDLWCQTASGSDPPFFHNALDRPTDRRTYVRTDWPTDHPRESLTTIGCCATTATRPNDDDDDDARWSCTFQRHITSRQFTCFCLHRLIVCIHFTRTCVPRPSSDLHTKVYGRTSQETPPSDALNARRVAKYSEFGPVERYISETVKDRHIVSIKDE